MQYNANSSGEAGGGGEYDVQTGFGWTNGVVIDFMVTFGDEVNDITLRLLSHYSVPRSHVSHW